MTVHMDVISKQSLKREPRGDNKKIKKLIQKNNEQKNLRRRKKYKKIISCEPVHNQGLKVRAPVSF